VRVLLCAVGRARKGPERALFEHFTAQLRWPFELREVEERKKLPVSQLQASEASLLLRAIPEGAVVVAMDERGKSLSSRALANQVGAWRDGGRDCIAFVIGGADGLDDTVRNSADLLLSFGKLTWPHLLVRGMLAEQLYRCQQILAGHPYHRD